MIHDATLATGKPKSQWPHFGIALHGDVWKKILEAEAKGSNLKHDFFDLAAKCRSVVACRLEPKEKVWTNILNVFHYSARLRPTLFMR